MCTLFRQSEKSTKQPELMAIVKQAKQNQPMPQNLSSDTGSDGKRKLERRGKHSVPPIRGKRTETGIKRPYTEIYLC